MGQHLALGHTDHRVTKPANEIHVVFDDHKCIAALLVQADNRVADGIEQGAVHTCANLVEEHDLGVNHHGAPQLQQLFLPTRQIARFFVFQMIDCQKFQHVIGFGLQCALFVCNALAAKPCVPQRLARLRAGHHHQVFAHGHGGKFMGNLERAQQAFVEQVMRRKTGDILAQHRHTAGRRLKNARDHIEKSGFSRTIWTDQAGNRAFFNAQGRTINGMKATKGFHHVFNDNHFFPPHVFITRRNLLKWRGN